MHGGLLWVTLCLSVCDDQNYWTIILFGRQGQRSHGSMSEVTLARFKWGSQRKAGRLTSTSSCFILEIHYPLLFQWPSVCIYISHVQVWVAYLYCICRKKPVPVCGENASTKSANSTLVSRFLDDCINQSDKVSYQLNTIHTYVLLRIGGKLHCKYNKLLNIKHGNKWKYHVVILITERGVEKISKALLQNNKEGST